MKFFKSIYTSNVLENNGEASIKSFTVPVYGIYCFGKEKLHRFDPEKKYTLRKCASL